MANGYINDGMATATAGSKTVTFAGVSVSLFRAGWIFQQGGASGTIASLDADAGTATLVENWGGETSDDAAYTVLIIPDSRVLAETTVRWLEYLNGPILSIAEMMGDDAPDDGETLVWDTAGWVTTDLLASPTITGHPIIEGVTSTGATGTGKIVFNTAPTFSGDVIFGGSSKITSNGDIIISMNRSISGSGAAGTGWGIYGSVADTVPAIIIQNGGMYYGGAASPGWNDGTWLEVKSGGGHIGISAWNTSNSFAFQGRIDNTSGRLAVWYYNTTQVGSISTNGTTTTYGTSSDERLKSNIADAGDAGAIIDALRVRQWDWKSDGTHEAFGFVAQEEALIYPPAVVAGDSDPETISQQWSRDDAKLVPLLVKCVQNLRRRLALIDGA